MSGKALHKLTMKQALVGFYNQNPAPQATEESRACPELADGEFCAESRFASTTNN
jgi:hypothetical protein